MAKTSFDIDALRENRPALERVLNDYERLKNQDNNQASGRFAEIEYLKFALNASDARVLIYSSDRRLCFYNTALQVKLDSVGADLKLGSTLKEVHATYLNALTGFDDAQKHSWVENQIEKFNEALETGKAIEGKRLDGTHYRLVVVQAQCGHIVQVQTDITSQKKKAEDFQKVLENTNQGIMIVDKQQRIEHINPAYIEIQGLEDFEFTPESTTFDLWNYLRAEDKFAVNYDNNDEWKAFIKEANAVIAKSKDEPQYFQMFADRHIKIKGCKFEDGREMFCVFDVTELTEKQIALEAETAKALTAERAKSEFLANMSHEIRTPMNGVMGMAELLMGTELDQRQTTFADTILRSGDALLTIINDILDFSKIDAGQIELHDAPFDLRDAIEDVVTLIAPRVASKDLELAVRIAPELPEMFIGDVGRVRQIITNLVGNAVKFTEIGHVVVDVSGTVEDGGSEGNRANLIIKVEDTGIGIPADKCATVFEKFNQVDTSAARKHEGTGLGLSITSSLVDLMGGNIEVESETGVGSTFTVTVSFTIANETRCKKEAPTDVSGARLLIIDDNEVNRSILLEQAKSWGFNARAAESGQKGLAIMEAAITLDESFDLLILDYHMPDLTGADVVEKMRAHSELSAIPIVMLTSVDQTKDGKAFQSLGIQSHLTKPARSSILLETLVTALQNHSSFCNRQALRSDEAPTNVDDVLEAVDDGIKLLRENVAHVSGSMDYKSTTDIDADKLTSCIDVLVAEDNAVNKEVFVQVLELLGVSYKIAKNGVKAVEYFKTYNPSVILMDISMPEMNGYDATTAIRELETTTEIHTPIIAVTAHAMTGDEEKCLAAGMDDYMTKPISPAKLKEIIQKWLNEPSRQISA